MNGTHYHLLPTTAGLRTPAAATSTTNAKVDGLSSLTSPVSTKLEETMLDVPTAPLEKKQENTVACTNNTTEQQLQQPENLLVMDDSPTASTENLNIVEEHEDGMKLTPNENLSSGELNSENDHRLFMAFSIAAMYIGDCTVTDPDSVQISYPNFISDMKNVGAQIFPL